VPRVVNLTFHGLGEPPAGLPAGEPEFWLGEQPFDAILDLVAGRDDVRLTFDDGNESDVDIALPALRERGLRATFFVVAGRIGKPGYLSPAGLDALAAAGMELGTHGMRHRRWRRLREAELHDELVAARALLERATGRDITRAACPFGSYDRRALRLLRRRGYERVYTSDCGPAERDAWLQPRNTIRRGDGPATVERLLAQARAGGQPPLRRLVLTAKRWR
jgi:peptidoglycan/xylan/chitin deacetylase (PgdA/CDA1 family)